MKVTEITRRKLASRRATRAEKTMIADGYKKVGEVTWKVYRGVELPDSGFKTLIWQKISKP